MLRPKLETSAITRRINPDFRDEVRAAACQHWHVIGSRCGIPSEALTGLRTKCPGCNSDYFKYLDERGGGSYVCRATGRADATGDGFALLRHVFGFDFGQAVRMAAQVMRVPELAAVKAMAARHDASKSGDFSGRLQRHEP